jgi:DNA polymerase-3 subunit gamma/tau
LKALTVKQIEDKLAEILSQEQVSHEQGCLTLLAKAARGSMRDSLSLTDQAIAQGQGNISLTNIQQMLGGIDQNWVYQLLIALLKQDSQALMTLSQEIASYAPSYSRLFAELIQLFHQIALMQIVEQHFDLPADLLALLKKFSQAMSAEDVQLYYQISLNGRKDLPYAFDEQAAFDMTLLRLFAFKPMQKAQLATKSTTDNAEQVAAANFDSVNLSKTTVNLANGVNDTKTVHVESVTKSITEANITDSVDIADNTRQADLNEQLLAIEQQADDLKQSESKPVNQIPAQIVSQEVKAPEQAPAVVTQQVPQNTPVEMPKEPEGQLSPHSPVGSVLATRNMLRSRKKELEKQTKKSSDATLRQPNNTDSEKDKSSPAVEVQVPSTESVVIAPEPEVPFHQDSIDPAKVTKANQVDKWAHMIDSMQLTARIRQLAIHATISENSTDDNLILQLDQATRHLSTEVAHQQLQSYICEFLSRQVTVTLNIVEETVADPYQIQVQINDKRLEYAKNLLKEDAVVIALQENFQASLNEESISPR